MLRLKVPRLSNPKIAFRLAVKQEEIDRANNLVLQNYFQVGLWSDREEFDRNAYIHSPQRACFVAIDGEQVLATVSTVSDSPLGLPADKFQPHPLKKFRANGEHIAEITALAVDTRTNHNRDLVLFLYAFIFQYSFYYAGIDRFIASTTEKHARFYEDVFGFQRLSVATEYYYVKLRVQLLSLHLLEFRTAMAECYRVDREYLPEDRGNFYHFLFASELPCFHYPERHSARRPRKYDWLARARLSYTSVAV